MKALNAAWRTGFADLADLSLPDTLPEGEIPLSDWYQFQLGGGRFIPSRARWIPAQGRAAPDGRLRPGPRAPALPPAGDFPRREPSDARAAALRPALSARVLRACP